MQDVRGSNGPGSSLPPSEPDRFYRSLINVPATRSLFPQDIYINYTTLLQQNNARRHGLLICRRRAILALKRIATKLEKVDRALALDSGADTFSHINIRRRNLCRFARRMNEWLLAQMEVEIKLRAERHELLKAQDAQNKAIMKKKVISHEEEIEELVGYMERYERPLLPEGGIYADWLQVRGAVRAIVRWNSRRIVTLKVLGGFLENENIWAVHWMCEQSMLALIAMSPDTCS